MAKNRVIEKNRVMGTNKFATMLHNNTNKITLILIYVILEWILIVLLLLNSVFSYFIIKFAQYFGLNPPCLPCAKIDENGSFRYHRCEFHSKEVFKMGLFSSSHQKLAEFRDLCENCSSPDSGFKKESRNFVFSKVKRIDEILIDGENEDNLNSGCCGVDFEKKFVDDSFCVVNSTDDHTEKKCLDDQIEDYHVEENRENESGKQSSEDVELETEEHEIELIRDLNSFEENLIQFDKGEDLHSHDLKFFIDYSGNQLFPFELLDSKTEGHGNNSDDHELLDSKTEKNQTNFEDEDHEFGHFQKANVNSREIDYSAYEKTEESIKFVENLIDFGNEEIMVDEENQSPSIENEQIPKIVSDIHSVQEEDDVSIGAEIPVLDLYNEIKLKHEEPSTNSIDFHSNIENDFEEAYSSKNVEEFEEEKQPETPSSIHSLNPFHKKWKESKIEESLDGSAISETDGDDSMNTTVKLKSALIAERKALQDLYSELEEERNASMVSANETMAMINRLQEEKSAMQMEALQYQRMMEEQAEYDQQALELLNELMKKKEKELELYRKKVLDYETNEKNRFSQKSTKTGTSSISWSHSEDEDRLSMDLCQIPNNGNRIDRETLGPLALVNPVLNLESLANFEEERISILEELKFLEEKLFALSGEEEQHFSKIRETDDHYEEINNTVNEFARNGKQPTGKRILPLSDAIRIVNEDGVTVRNGMIVKTVFRPTKLEDTAVTRFELEKKRIDMEQEIDQLYGRLQALEADREFLKRCIWSTKKGDKGIELLQEILYHLRDLRNVNIRAKNYADNTFL